MYVLHGYADHIAIDGSTSIFTLHRLDPDGGHLE